MATYTNGNIPTSVMKTFGGKYGHPVFIDQLTAFAAECKRHGINVYVAEKQDIFRDYAGQVYWKNYWTNLGKPGNAAKPGTSNHGLGVAADISGVGGWGSSTHNTAKTIAARHGLAFTVPSESWHIESTRISTAGNRVTINGASGGGGATNETRQFQTDLFFLGYNVGIDGIKGQNTTDGTVQFQKDHGLTPDGIIGPKTLAKMKAVITAIQNQLKAAGFNTGPSDGWSGPTTVAATKAFQTARGLTADGRVGNQTKAALNTPVNTNPKGAVLKIQKSLNKLGANPKLAEDDTPGPATTAAIKAFQKKHGLLEDGLVGDGTQLVIDAELKKLENPPVVNPPIIVPEPHDVPPIGYAYGVDVAWPQTRSFDWAKLSEEQTFVIIKASGAEDPEPNRVYGPAQLLDKHLIGVRSVMLTAGFYHFNNGNVNVEEQAAKFVEVVKTRILKGDVVALDIEDDGPTCPHFTPEQALEFANYVEKHLGIKTLMYMNQSVMNNFDWSEVVAAGHPLWLATLNGSMHTAPTKYWDNWTVNQYVVDNDGVAGYNGPIDRNLIKVGALQPYGFTDFPVIVIPDLPDTPVEEPEVPVEPEVPETPADAPIGAKWAGIITAIIAALGLIIAALTEALQ